MKTFNRIMTAGMSLVLTLSIAGCSASSGSTASSKDHLARIKEAGVLHVGVEGDWQPFNYHADPSDPSSKLEGYDVDVAAEIARRIGVDAEYTESDFDSLLNGVHSGADGFDIVANGVTMDDERRQSYYFSDAYLYDPAVLVVREDDNDIKSFEDIKGRVAVNSLGSTYAEIDEKYGATVINLDTLAECMDAVKNGNQDASVTINAQTSVQDYFKTNGQDGLKIAARMEDPDEYGIAMQKDADNDTLLKAVNDALADMRKDGTLTDLSNKYFGADLTNK